MLPCMFALYFLSLTAEPTNTIKEASEPMYDEITNELWTDNVDKAAVNPVYNTNIQVEADPAYSMPGNQEIESDNLYYF